MVSALRLGVEVRVQKDAGGDCDGQLNSTSGHLELMLQMSYRVAFYFPAVTGVSVRALWRDFIQLCSCAM